MGVVVAWLAHNQQDSVRFWNPQQCNMNKKDKNKKLINVKQDIIHKADNLAEIFTDFSDGIRVMFLIQRHKEGGEINNTKLQKIITTNKEEWYDALVKLLVEQSKSEAPVRIYASCNERDFKKAVRVFKTEQLDHDYVGENLFQRFYLDIRNNFISCLTRPQQKKTSYFLFDVDNDGNRDVVGELLASLGDFQDNIVLQYPTKNGWHIITKPFNYNLITLPSSVELKTDGLMLLAW